MNDKIGRSIDSPPELTGINPQQLLSSSILTNGNMENGYEFRGTCRYFFEINPQTRKIVSWRFEGAERDCSITP
jgi:hypothetical protein